PLLDLKAQRIADLTVSDAIKLLEPLQSPEEPRILPGRRGKRRDPVLGAIKNGPLAILQRAWEAAGEKRAGNIQEAEWSYGSLGVCNLTSSPMELHKGPEEF